ncbi:hypothetical protein LINPERHAP1_LOCUS16774 [Linum perenne]
MIPMRRHMVFCCPITIGRCGMV